MADLLCKDSELIALADTIRNKKGDGSSVKYGFPTGMADAVSSLNVGVGLSPAATAADIRNGKKAVVDRVTITGTMTEKAAATYNTSTTDQEIAAGQYLTGKQTIRKVTTSNLSAGNIKAGVTVNVGDAGDDDRVASVAGTFTSDGTATAGDILSEKTAYVNGSKITGTITTKTSTDMTVSGKTVTAPAGYYASNQSKSVVTGSATTPATTITANPTISISSAGKITASVSKTQNVTPTVSAGYVSSGTAGTITVSGSATNQMTLRTSSDMTVSSETVTAPAGYYASNQNKSVEVATLPTSTTSSGYGWEKATITPSATTKYINIPKGYVTTESYYKIAGDADLVAANIKSGVAIFGVTGTLPYTLGSGFSTFSATNVKLSTSTTVNAKSFVRITSGTSCSVSTVPSNASPWFMVPSNAATGVGCTYNNSLRIIAMVGQTNVKPSDTSLSDFYLYLYNNSDSAITVPANTVIYTNYLSLQYALLQ